MGAAAQRRRARRPARARAAVAAGLGGLALGLGAVSLPTCHGTPAQTGQPHDAVADGAAAAGSSPTTSAAPPSEAGADLPPDGGAKPDADATSDASWSAQAISAAQSCHDPRSAILNHPDGGVVFNNAMTSADAGHIDRMQRVLGELASRAERFRCCFDIWGSDHPGEEAELMLIITLTPAGEAQTVKVDDERSTITDEMARACVVATAAHPGYPASPTGKMTIVEYPFRISAGAK